MSFFVSFTVLFREAIFSFADFHCFTSWSYCFAINQYGAESSAKFVSRRFNFSITGAISLLRISLNCSNSAILSTRNTLKPLKTTSYGHHIKVSLSAIWLPNNTQLSKKIGLEQRLHSSAPSFVPTTFKQKVFTYCDFVINTNAVANS